jgi:hypothetical protein
LDVRQSTDLGSLVSVPGSVGIALGVQKVADYDQGVRGFGVARVQCLLVSGMHAVEIGLLLQQVQQPDESAGSKFRMRVNDVLVDASRRGGEETLHVVEAANENEIKARLAEDPWACAGLLKIGTIEPWAFWLGSRPWNPAR